MINQRTVFIRLAGGVYNNFAINLLVFLYIFSIKILPIRVLNLLKPL
jgi:hypothetical protein